MNLRARLMWPLLGLLVLLLVGMASVSSYTYRYFLAQQMRQQLVAAEQHLKAATQQESTKLAAVTHMLLRDRALRQGLATQDRDKLQAVAGPLFEELRRQYGISHFYLTNPQRINIMRLHQPERFGDRIDRITTLTAEQSGQAAWGVELGPLGTFTLRYVQPVWQEGRLLGYLELGEEIEHLLQGMQRAFGSQQVVVIEKRYLDQAAWRAGMEMLGRIADWNGYLDVVVVEQGLAELPPLVQQLLRNYTATPRMQPLFTEIDGRNFVIGTLPLHDAADREVGMLLMLTDSTAVMAEMTTSRWRNLTGVAVILAAIILLFHVLLRRTERELGAAHRRLLEEQQLKEQGLKKLEQAHQEWMVAFDAVEDAMFLHDCEHRLMRVNHAYLRQAGKTLEECIGKPYWQVYPLREGPLCSCLEARVSEMEQEEEIELEDGTILLSRSVPVFANDGSYLHSLHIMQDITARRRADAAMRLRDRAIESSSNGIVITDFTAHDNPLIYANTAFEKITGYSRDEIVGRNLRFLYNTDTEQSGLEDVRAAVREGNACQVVLRNYRKNGERFWNELSLAPVRDEKGKVTHYVGAINDISARKEYEEYLVHQANYDQLTGLANRNLLTDRGEQAIAHAQRNGMMMAVLLLDLDRFKVVVDTLGHQAGDELLREVAARLNRCVAEGDTVARLGADEFVVLLTELESADHVVSFERRLLGALEKPLQLCEQDTYLAASIGVSLYPRDGGRFDTLLKNADAAMHRAKERGGGGIEFYAEEMTSRTSRQLAVDASLRYAMQRNELMLHFQPKVDLGSGMVVGAEALVRWRHPEWGMMSPGEFIPVAEETGLIVALGEWVLEEACEQHRAWLAQGLPPMTVAVNLSARQFRQSNLVSIIQQALSVYEMEPQYLELELTESMVMHDPVAAIATMLQLKSLGVRLSLDDFGTGYSSLAYLKQFPIDCLKIDTSFVREITSDPSNAAISLAVIAMAHSLGKKVVAEGVETEAQLNFLRRHRCDEIQGFFFSRPLPAGEFTELLRQRSGLVPLAQAGITDQPTMLILDDEPNVIRALQRVLRREGYRILAATSASEAFELLANNQVQVVLSDQRMPGISGIEFLSRVKRLYPDTVRMVLSGYTELSTVTEAVNQGAIYKFLTKPWDDEVLRKAVRAAFLRAEGERSRHIASCHSA